MKKGTSPTRYSAEELDWLKEHLDDYANTIEMTDAFNANFGKSITYDSLRHKLQNLGLHRERKTVFKSGQKGFTSFPIGTERIRKDKNNKYHIWVKVNDDVRRRGEDKGSYNYHWQAKHKVVWESAHGAIPKGKCIMFIDGNTLNCDINNLILVDNAVNGIMVGNKWELNDCEQLNKAKIGWCEHKIALKEAGV